MAEVWGGAGHTKSWDDQQGPHPSTHWYNIRDKWIENADNLFNPLPMSWTNAIKNPGKAFEVRYINGWTFVYYDPDRKQVLSGNYECPMRNHHHLYDTCWCCGQYG